MSIEEAKKSGAMALFGEKYGDIVRVVDMNVSKEFCGGTHVNNTKDIEKFGICSYESIGSGIFRITGTTSKDSDALINETLVNQYQDIYTLINKGQRLLKEAQEKGLNINYNLEFNEQPASGYRKVLALRQEFSNVQASLHQLEKLINDELKKNTMSNLDHYKDQIVNNALVLKVTDIDKSLLKETAATLLNNFNLRVCFLALAEANSIVFVCATDESVSAVDLIKAATKVTGGGGGGKKNLAQAGGKDPNKLDEALEVVKGLI